MKDLKQHIISTTEERKEFITDIDGFIYWWPEGSRRGHLSSAHLRILADELDKKNEAWDRQIKDYFRNQEKKEKP